MVEVITERQIRDLPFWCDTALSVEKLRVACQVRATHLELQGRRNEETDNLIELLVGVEGYVDGQLAKWVLSHPAYPWFSRVKGIGKENIGKVIGMVDIERAPTVSALWKFAGFAVEDGKAPKPKKGEKNTYNARLRTMCWRVGSSLMRAGGGFYDYYIVEKEKETAKLLLDGWTIKAAAKYDLEKKRISVGHVHNRALRKMIKLFLACLWKVWREAEGLPIRSPYAMTIGHTHEIQPLDMVDR